MIAVGLEAPMAPPCGLPLSGQIPCDPDAIADDHQEKSTASFRDGIVHNENPKIAGSNPGPRDWFRVVARSDRAQSGKTLTATF